MAPLSSHSTGRNSEFSSWRPARGRHSEDTFEKVPNRDIQEEEEVNAPSEKPRALGKDHRDHPQAEENDHSNACEEDQPGAGADEAKDRPDIEEEEREEDDDQPGADRDDAEAGNDDHRGEDAGNW